MRDNLNVEKLKIYGFGSFFRGAKIFNDIDFLIIHETFSKLSCQAAIKCKYLIFNELINSDISILSIKEEKSLNFIIKSNAIFLGEVSTFDMKKDLAYILDNKVLNKTISDTAV